MVDSVVYLWFSRFTRPMIPRPETVSRAHSRGDDDIVAAAFGQALSWPVLFLQRSVLNPIATADTVTALARCQYNFILVI